jgi:RND family efflux transporter MFP subunit
MKKKQLTLKVLAIALVTMATACQPEKEQASESFAAEVIAVKVFPVQSTNGKHTITATGLLSTQREAMYSFKTPGIIDKIYVEEGEFFRKGKLLASLKLTEITSGEMQAQLGMEKARRDFERAQNLYTDSVATLEQLQNAKTALNIAEKQLEVVAFNRQYAYIYAEKEGFVRKKIANEGEIVGGGTPVLAINEQSQNIWDLKVGLSDKDWALVEVGNQAEVVLDAFPGRVLRGTVFRKSLAADQGTGSFQVEINVQADDLKPALGMFGKVKIDTDRAVPYTAIPYEALVEADGKHAFVFVPLANGKVRKQSVIVESFNAQEVRIGSGLENIEELVLTNTAFLNENSLIKISK